MYISPKRLLPAQEQLKNTIYFTNANGGNMLQPFLFHYILLGMTDIFYFWRLIETQILPCGCYLMAIIETLINILV